ncbi:methylenetetrahydrofolate reductase [Rubrobacter marinus]|uniref:Methylenetetrahydrofolate reductase n=1 Tax=Rubrobacter marinus TaxID=2653852 RepID=A0A6G8Q2R9_9ACTN|nr:methylenetetrahydrofolate reductase [Rubrobacter marinus]
MEHPRYELVPVEGAREQAIYLPAGAEVSVTCSPTLGIGSTIALAEELLARGFPVVPHLAARLIEDETRLKAVLGRLEERGLKDVFVVGGDSKVPAGPYASGLTLLRAMSRLGAGIERVGVPAYPEGHPLVAEEELTRALLAKQPFASYAVTQICFEPETVLGWLARAREGGLKLPVYVGVPGVVDRKKLLRISLKIGLGDSMRFLKKQTGLVGRLLRPRGYSPDALIEGLSPYVGDPDYGIRGFHVNTFNHVEETERWRRGRLGSTADGGVFEGVRRAAPAPMQGKE